MTDMNIISGQSGASHGRSHNSAMTTSEVIQYWLICMATFPLFLVDTVVRRLRLDRPKKKVSILREAWNSMHVAISTAF